MKMSIVVICAGFGVIFLSVFAACNAWRNTSTSPRAPTVMPLDTLEMRKTAEGKKDPFSCCSYIGTAYEAIDRNIKYEMLTDRGGPYGSGTGYKVTNLSTGEVLLEGYALHAGYAMLNMQNLRGAPIETEEEMNYRREEARKRAIAKSGG